MKLLVSSLTLLAASAAMAITVAEAKLLAPGSTVTIENVRLVTDTDLVNNVTLRDVVVDDPTGGVTIFGSNAAMDTLMAGISVGDRFTVTGVTGSFNGKFQLLAPFTSSNIQDVNQPVPFLYVNMSDFQDNIVTAEGYESRLVRVGPVNFVDSGTFAGLTNYSITDGTLSTVSRVSTTTQNLVGMEIPPGPVLLSGIFSQFDSTDPRTGGYQLLLRSRTDVKRVAFPTGAFVDSGEAFQGDVASLAVSDNNEFSLLSDSITLAGSAVISGSVPAEVLTIEVVMESRADRLGIAEQVQIKNWSTGNWLSIGGRIATGSDSFWNSATVANSVPFRRFDGEVQSRISWNPVNDEDPSQDGWALALDRVLFAYEQ